MKNKFKVGDKVYLPYYSSKVFILKSNNFNLIFPFKIESDKINMYFTLSGKRSLLSKRPVIFHATQGNKNALELLYNIDFDEP